MIEKGVLKPATVHQEFRVLRRMLNVAVRKKLLPANPCCGRRVSGGGEGPVPAALHVVVGAAADRVRRRRATCATSIRIITETGLRVYKELTPMKKDQVDLENAVVWIPDSKTPNGVAEVPLTDLAVEAFRDQMRARWGRAVSVSERREPERASDDVQDGLGGRRCGGRRSRTSGSTICGRPTRRGLSAGGVADEWVTQLLRQGDAKVFKKYSQMKLQMKREALQKLNRSARTRAGFWDRSS